MTDVVEAFNSEPRGVAMFEDHNGLVSHELVAEHLSAKVNNVSNKIAGIDCGGIDLDDSKILSEVVLTNAENERGGERITWPIIRFFGSSQSFLMSARNCSSCGIAFSALSNWRCASSRFT